MMSHEILFVNNRRCNWSSFYWWTGLFGG